VFLRREVAFNWKRQEMDKKQKELGRKGERNYGVKK
jgi:hypothetical protein